MSYDHESECIAASLDPKEVRRISKGLSRYAKQAEALGLVVFSGTGTGTLRTRNQADKGEFVVAELDGKFDGGDGGTYFDANGLQRSEVE